MPKLPGINHLDAVRALQNAGYRILRQDKHIIMTGSKKGQNYLICRTRAFQPLFPQLGRLDGRWHLWRHLSASG